jgi:hypothetical protein
VPRMTIPSNGIYSTKEKTVGTRSLTIISDDKEICVMYRQFDGYIDGHGHELAAFLSGMTIVNGLGGNKEKIANGASCLAAQVIAHFKVKPGDIYLYPSGTRDCGEEYTYFVTAKESEPITVKVVAYGKEIFSGTPEELALFEEPEED